MDQKHLRNLPLNVFQYLIRDGQISNAAALLGEFCLMVMLADVVADGVKVDVIND